jgi:hypothetical protein
MRITRSHVGWSCVLALAVLLAMALPWEEERWSNEPIGPGAGIARPPWTAMTWPFPIVGVAVLIAAVGTWRCTRPVRERASGGERRRAAHRWRIVAVASAALAVLIVGGAFALLLTVERSRPALGLTLAFAASAELVVCTLGGGGGRRWWPLHVALVLLAACVRPDEVTDSGRSYGRRIDGRWIEFSVEPDRIPLAFVVESDGQFRTRSHGRSDGTSWFDLERSDGTIHRVRWDSRTIELGRERLARTGAVVCVAWLDARGAKGELLATPLRALRPRGWLRFLQHGVIDELKRVAGDAELAGALERLRR